MRIRVGCEFHYESPGPTAAIWQVRPRPNDAQQMVSEIWTAAPETPSIFYFDVYGNMCDRMTLPEGRSTIRYDAVFEVPGQFDEADKAAREIPVVDLPNDALVFLLPSRFCLSDVLYDTAWDLFGSVEPGWNRVQAVSDWVHENIQFAAGCSTPLTTAETVFQSRRGVCRDFAHLGVTFCRSLNIPARYVFGYLPDIGIPPPDDIMDFCAWMEVYLDGRWWTFDPRNNVPRTGRVLIGRGRDALDVAMVTTYGSPVLHTMEVWADEVPS